MMTEYIKPDNQEEKMETSKRVKTKVIKNLIVSTAFVKVHVKPVMQKVFILRKKNGEEKRICQSMTV
jgi:hypothetical protein